MTSIVIPVGLLAVAARGAAEAAGLIEPAPPWQVEGWALWIGDGENMCVHSVYRTIEGCLEARREVTMEHRDLDTYVGTAVFYEPTADCHYVPSAENGKCFCGTPLSASYCNTCGRSW
jgi:hypothetical protein